MGSIRRWTATVAGSFDWIIGQIENHDAVVKSAIKEMEASTVKAKVQLKRVKVDGDKLKDRLETARKDQKLWKERALSLKESDKEKAIECLRRQKIAAADVTRLERELAEHESLEAQLNRDLKTATEGIEKLKRKRNSMNAREYRADAIKAGDEQSLSIVTEIDEIFERWDMKVSCLEVSAEPIDNLEQEFETKEEYELLEAELENLDS